MKVGLKSTNKIFLNHQDRESGDNQRRLNSTKHIKYAITNTGRFAFGTVEEVREIYKLHAAKLEPPAEVANNLKNVPNISKAKAPVSQHPSAGLSKNMSTLSVSTNNASATKQLVGVGVSGRAAAMSRMAALGEEWAEEEDLPMAGPASHLLSGSGGVNKAVTKEMQNSKQRQGQRNSAKSRY